MSRSGYDDDDGDDPLAGKGRAPYLSAARALVRKGLAFAGQHTGHYGATDAGRAAVADFSIPSASTST